MTTPPDPFDLWGFFAEPAPTFDEVGRVRLPPKRRVRRRPLASTVKQLWKAARAAGIHVAVSIEGGRVTATPVNGIAAPGGESNDNDSPRRSLFKTRVHPKQKVVL
jgi:hypothetical protein